jgi:hypothetical protein
MVFDGYTAADAANPNKLKPLEGFGLFKVY